MLTDVSADVAGERPVSPQDCALLVCVPASEADFRAHFTRDRGYIADMARELGWTPRSLDAAWTLYRRIAVEPVRATARRVSELGVEVVWEAELAALTKCCERKRVVTLFGHCDTADPAAVAVEFARGLVPLSRVLAGVPASYAGVLELALCHSWQLGEIVKSQRPACLVVMHEHQTRPAFRAPFYRAVMEELNLRPRRYTDALIDLAKELLQ